MFLRVLTKNYRNPVEYIVVYKTRSQRCSENRSEEIFPDGLVALARG